MVNEEAKEKVNDLVAVPQEKLTSWAVDFIADMIDRDEFTENQLNKIEELWNRYCR